MTETYYVFENGAWRASANEIENNLGACVSSRQNEVVKFADSYYTCKTGDWTLSTALEYDTYGWSAGIEGEVKAGSVNSSNHYVYVEGAWRATTNDMEYEYGACVTSKDGEKHIQSGKYYICENKTWKQITAEEYGLGYCSASNNGVVEMLNEVYYICKSGSWNVATVLEYDTYGKTCLTDGTIVSGEVETSNKYVCDANSFRVANEQEQSLNKGCVNYTENEIVRKQISDTQDSIYTCKSGLWVGSVGNHVVYGTLTDARDGKTYKTVVIGTQTWMAENLNYSDSTNYLSMKGRSWCYYNSLNNCAKYGRLYTWAAAMDSVGTFSTNGKGCGYGKTCTPTYPVRGICPDGWHLPQKTEWEMLFTAVGGKSTAAKMLKSTSGWKYNGNGEDSFGFSALPAGYYYDGDFNLDGLSAYFWSSTEDNGGDAYYMYLVYYYDDAYLRYITKYNGFSVRCLRD